MPGTIIIANAVLQTWLLIVAMIIALTLSARRTTANTLLPIGVTQELKGVAILAVVFGHIGYFLVDDNRFLFPLSIGAGVGVNIFLLLSGYGLTLGLLSKPLPALEFYRRRMIKIFIPFWCALIAFFVLDAFVLHRTYSSTYIVRSLFGFFPRADMADDINSVFWYITWILFYYLLLPLLFMPRRPWLTALLLYLSGEALVRWNPPAIELVTRLYQVHTVAFPLGMVLAWLLYEPKNGSNTIATKLKTLKREMPSAPYYLTLLVFTAIAAYCAYFNGIGESIQKEQLMSILTTLALLGLFAVKRFELRLFSLIGVYSYEMYLLHWPIVSRYDVIYSHLPAALATIVYIALFLAMGWCIQKFTAPVSVWIDSKSKPVQQ
jgi:peptidoglycan/LPS O-acetylase OafA/YrhL